LLFTNTCPPTAASYICGNEDASACTAGTTSAVVDNVALTVGQDILIDVSSYNTTNLGGPFTLTITRLP
jgi:hypothetical protein